MIKKLLLVKTNPSAGQWVLPLNKEHHCDQQTSERHWNTEFVEEDTMPPTHSVKYWTRPHAHFYTDTLSSAELQGDDQQHGEKELQKNAS